MSGKGDTPRPYSVDADTFAANWERAFGAKAQASSNKDDDNGEAAEVPDAGAV